MLEREALPTAVLRVELPRDTELPAVAELPVAVPLPEVAFALPTELFCAAAALD